MKTPASSNLVPGVHATVALRVKSLFTHLIRPIVLSFAIVTFSVGRAQASIIVDVPGNSFAGTSVFLTAGTYETTPIGIASGGAYDAWSVHSGQAGTWVIDYSISSSEINIVHNGGTNGVFNNALDALAAGTMETFVLTFGQNVKFWVQDTVNYGDNVGGVSLNLVGGVPEPPTILLLFFGGLLGFALRRRPAVGLRRR